MACMEQLELDAHRGQLEKDLQTLVENYRSIFEWDIPEIDQARADRLIFEALRAALDNVELALVTKAGHD
ncbi:MAG: hypothetical protein ABIP34_20630 [Rhodoferax sp.]|uniref:hypothetical protein n=1 Tax=Rhodoferax sp. TaxID=50421 RepID=UPI003266A840